MTRRNLIPRRIRSLWARIANTAFWVSRGMSIGYAWNKADDTFTYPESYELPM